MLPIVRSRAERDGKREEEERRVVGASDRRSERRIGVEAVRNGRLL